MFTSLLCLLIVARLSPVAGELSQFLMFLFFLRSFSFVVVVSVQVLSPCWLLLTIRCNLQSVVIVMIIVIATEFQRIKARFDCKRRHLTE